MCWGGLISEVGAGGWFLFSEEKGKRKWMKGEGGEEGRDCDHDVKGINKLVKIILG